MQLDEKYKNQLVYISGPISGCENLNREEFTRVELLLFNNGFVPVNPFGLTENDSYLEELMRSLELAKTESDKLRINNLIWRHCMTIDIEALLKCKLVVVLKNWETSKGANLEICIAQKLGIPVLLEGTFEPINYTFDIIKKIQK